MKPNTTVWWCVCACVPELSPSICESICEHLAIQANQQEQTQTDMLQRRTPGEGLADVVGRVD